MESKILFWILDTQPYLTGSELRVAVSLFSLMADVDGALIDIWEIAEQANMHPNSVRPALKLLQEKGLIRITKNGNTAPYIKWVCDLRVTKSMKQVSNENHKISESELVELRTDALKQLLKGDEI